MEKKTGEAMSFRAVQGFMRIFSLLALVAFLISKAVAADPAAEMASSKCERDASETSPTRESSNGEWMACDRDERLRVSSRRVTEPGRLPAGQDDRLH